MRKNKVPFKNLEIYSTYEIKGLNLDRLLNTLQKKGVYVYDTKKVSNKKLFITVKFCEVEKFCAILEDLCYTNIRKVKEFGKGYFLLFFFRNLGLLLGAVFFIIACAFCNDLVFSFSYSGSGSVLSREVESYLKERGVNVTSRFSQIDMESLSNGILANNPRLSFAECSKYGNRLNVELVLANQGERVLEGNKTSLTADFDGVVKEIKVYRGRALVGVGDSVKKGDTLVTNKVIVKDTEVEVGVVAFVTIAVEYSYVYESENDGEEDYAVLIAQSTLAEKETSGIVTKTKGKDKYIYNVTLTYDRVIFTG